MCEEVDEKGEGVKVKIIREKNYSFGNCILEFHANNIIKHSITPSNGSTESALLLTQASCQKKNRHRIDEYLV